MGGKVLDYDKTISQNRQNLEYEKMLAILNLPVKLQVAKIIIILTTFRKLKKIPPKTLFPFSFKFKTALGIEFLILSYSYLFGETRKVFHLAFNSWKNSYKQQFNRNQIKKKVQYYL